MTKYFIGVACLNHVQRGVAGGFAQLGHGKKTGLARLDIGDWLIYYSPRTEMKSGDVLQAFSAIGQVIGEIHQVSGDCPYRRDVAFRQASLAPIKPLISQLSFVKDPQRWGYPFRVGQLEIVKTDFDLIAGAMLTGLQDK